MMGGSRRLVRRGPFSLREDLDIMRAGIAGLVAALTLLAGCTEPPASSRVVPGTAAGAASGASAPRSPGNAALAVRAVLLFEQACLGLDAEHSARTFEGLGFQRASASNAAAMLGSAAGRAWAYRGYDAYIAAFRDGPPTSCELGVQLAEAQQVEAPFAAMMQRLRERGWAVSALGREPRMGAVLYRAVDPEGRSFGFALAPLPPSNTLFRSALIVQEAAARAR